MQSVSTLLAREQLEPLVRVEARVVQQRGRAAQPRGDEDVAGRLRPARGGGAPRQPPGSRREPVLGLDALAGEVALAVQDGLRLARGAGGEGDEARVLGLELDRRVRLGGGQLRAGDEQDVGVRAPPRRARRRCARRTRSAAGARPSSRDAQVGRAQLLGARQHDRADAEAGQHRQHPLGPVADQRQHDVAARRRRAPPGRPPRAPTPPRPPRSSIRCASRRAPSATSARADGRRGVDDVPARSSLARADPRHNGVQDPVVVGADADLCWRS